MGCKIIYSCDICREEMHKSKLHGCNFSGMKTFKLDTASSTDGIHICEDCLLILKNEIARIDIRETYES